ncbi:MAG TPA: CTP synthase [Planctomycetota bacterium]|nr:CTP synthase [Planctomycetota bacterium]
MAKHIFITGGVVSSLGKGITTGAVGMLLKRMGLTVKLQKLDPYLNVDPGTMNPYEHGEVYVTEDGAETDLDLGHYERFTGDFVSRESNYTMGQIYSAVISKERRGDYLGKTVQVVPHTTDEIKNCIRKLVQPGVDVVITEVGGTVGDIEGAPMLEAIRQFRHEVGSRNCMFIHLTLVPFIKAAGEVKTKPTQQSVGELRRIGIQPDILVVRTEVHLNDDARKKIALYCNVDAEAVIVEKDVDYSIYEVPLAVYNQGMDKLVAERLSLPVGKPRITDWIDVVESIKHPEHRIKIAIVGKYMKIQDAYKSIFESIAHAGIHHKTKVEIVKIEAESLEKRGGLTQLEGIQGILVPGGFGERGTEGKIAAIRYARENKIPYYGLCLGMQLAVIEFGRHVCGLGDATSTEFKVGCQNPVIDLMPDQANVATKGGTMRLGAYPCALKENTKAAAAYGKKQVDERHRHRYEFNNKYREVYEHRGMTFSGLSPDGRLVEIVELADHPWFVAVQFHPEFKSTPTAAHPLFRDFIGASLKYAKDQGVDTRVKKLESSASAEATRVE